VTRTKNSTRRKFVETSQNLLYVPLPPPNQPNLSFRMPGNREKKTHRYELDPPREQVPAFSITTTVPGESSIIALHIRRIGENYETVRRTPGYTENELRDLFGPEQSRGYQSALTSTRTIQNTSLFSDNELLQIFGPDQTRGYQGAWMSPTPNLPPRNTSPVFDTLAQSIGFLNGIFNLPPPSPCSTPPLPTTIMAPPPPPSTTPPPPFTATPPSKTLSPPPPCMQY
jgi:hypothetical protein